MDERSNRIQERFEWPMVIAALLVIPLVYIESADLDEPWETIGVVLNWVTWSAFLVELIVMLHVSPRPTEWLRRYPLDAAVVVLSPPFIPGSFGAIRLFRLLRVLRLGRLFTLRRLLSLEGLRYAFFVTVLIALLGGAAFASVETSQHLTTWDGVWWAFTTMTTVGYGDILPHTTEGRVIAIAVMSAGISFVAYLTAFIADRFIRRDVEEEISEHDLAMLQSLRRIEQRLDRLESRRDRG